MGRGSCPAFCTGLAPKSSARPWDVASVARSVRGPSLAKALLGASPGRLLENAVRRHHDTHAARLLAPPPIPWRSWRFIFLHRPSPQTRLPLAPSRCPSPQTRSPLAPSRLPLAQARLPLAPSRCPSPQARLHFGPSRLPLAPNAIAPRPIAIAPHPIAIGQSPHRDCPSPHRDCRFAPSRLPLAPSRLHPPVSRLGFGDQR
jgi:hypothetical protein